MTRDVRGQALAAGFVAVMVLALLAAGVADYYRLQTLRDFAERVAYEAALVGAARGRDWGAITQTGQLRLDAGRAEAAARETLTAVLNAAGIMRFSADVRVLPEPSGGVMTGFPPVSRAAAFDAPDWTSEQPAVGVYLELTAPTVLFGLVDGGDDVVVHAFGAAGAVQLKRR